MNRKDFIKAQKHLEDTFIRYSIYGSDHTYWITNDNKLVYIYNSTSISIDGLTICHPFQPYNLEFLKSLYNPSLLYWKELRIAYKVFKIQSNITRIEYRALSNIMFFFDMFTNVYNMEVKIEINDELIKKVKVLQENRAARIIQNGCHNWLYNPKCRDGTIGIVPNLSLKNLNII